MRPALSVLVMLALVLLIYLGMWRGWRARAQRQAGVPTLHPVPGGAEEVLRTADGRYFATTTAGNWMDRVVVHGLGVRGPCTLRLTPDGLEVLRDPDSFFVARADLLGARRDRGTAGKVVPPYGVLVLSWRHPGVAAGRDADQHVLDSGFRLQHADEHDAWVDAITTLIAAPPVRPAPAREADR